MQISLSHAVPSSLQGIDAESCKRQFDHRLLVCLSCSNALICKPCFRRHSKSCVGLKLAIRRWLRREKSSRIAQYAICRSPVLIECTNRDEDCILHKTQPAWDKKQLDTLVLIRWVKLLNGIHSKNRLASPLLALGKRTVFNHHLISMVVEWLFFSFD